MDDFMGMRSRESDDAIVDNGMFADCSAFHRDVFAYAMSYVPKQPLKAVYADTAALSRGTLFPELDKPFLCAKK